MHKGVHFIVVLLAGLWVTGCTSPPPPPPPPTLVGEAESALNRGDYQLALTKAERVLLVNDRNRTAIYIRGMAAFALNELTIAKEALSSVRSAFSLSDLRCRRIVKTLAKTHFKLKEFSEAHAVYQDYLALKDQAGSVLIDDDLYWAGVMADVNLKDDERDQWWSRLSAGFRKEKGIK